MYCGGATLVIGVTLPRALWPVSSGALPQVLEGHAPKTAPDLEVVGEQENLPALLQFSLDLNSRTKNTVTTNTIRCIVSFIHTVHLEKMVTNLVSCSFFFYICFGFKPLTKISKCLLLLSIVWYPAGSIHYFA